MSKAFNWSIIKLQNDLEIPSLTMSSDSRS